MIRRIVLPWLWPALLGAAGLPQQLAVPGGLVHVPAGDLAGPSPQVYYGGRRALVAAQGDSWVALVGIPLSAKAGRHEVTIKTADRTRQAAFSVSMKEYPAQRITLKNTHMVNPEPEDLERIKADRVAIDAALATWTEQDTVDTDFVSPVEGKLTSLFGLRRFFNKQARSPHSGVDIAAPAGKPVKAPACARVISTGNYFYNGKTVFLDHGQGLISAYFHMNEVKVRAGQKLERGDLLGTVGATGRATGPHLHWSIYLNGAQVDPTLFIAADLPRLRGKPQERRGRLRLPPPAPAPRTRESDHETR
jgi:murein DD-endopeptidase MepM/ murein hydrolase activator NlpD